MTVPRRALILARLSEVERVEAEDGGKILDTEAIRDQISDLVAHAADIGWGIGPAATHILGENDVPSYHSRMVTMPDGRRERRPKRPVFWRALQMFRDGEADGLVIVDTDRITRHPRDGEDLIDVVELHGVQVTSMSAGDLNLNTPQGRADLRQRVAHANWSSADTSRRVAAKRRRLALAGKPVGGPRRFGWEPGNIELRSWRWPGYEVPPLQGEDVWHKGEPVPGSEAAELRAMADQILHGVSLRQVAADLRARGVKGAQGGQSWDSSSVKWALLHPAIMGRLVYRQAHPAGVPRTNGARLFAPDQIKGSAPWPPIVSEDEYWALRELLTDAKRRSTPGNVPRWLLSLIAECGECDTGLVSVIKRTRGTASYRCRSCSAFHGAPAGVADAYVSMVICRRLAREDAADLIPRKPPSADTEVLERERAALRARKTSQARMHAQGLLDDDDLAEGLAEIRDRLAAVESQLATGSKSPLESIAGRADAERIWSGMPLGLKREIIRAVATVTLYRTPNSTAFDPDTVVLSWHA